MKINHSPINMAKIGPSGPAPKGGPGKSVRPITEVIRRMPLVLLPAKPAYLVAGWVLGLKHPELVLQREPDRQEQLLLSQALPLPQRRQL